MSDILLSRYIKVYDNVLSKNQCDFLIEQYNTHSNYVTEYRTEWYNFDQIELNSIPELSHIVHDVYSGLIGVFKEYFKEMGVDEYLTIENMEALRIKKYQKNSEQRFDDHVDVSCLASSARFLTGIFYLNDTDGNTIFPQLDISVKPKVGQLLIFPPLWLFPHAGLPATQNDKYIMMSSAMFT